MARVFVFLCAIGTGMAMSVKTEASKKLSYASPDGESNMFFERSSTDDLDSSASGYIYQSNGAGPAMVVKLGPHPAAQAFDQINQAYESLIHPIAQEYVGGVGGQDYLGSGLGQDYIGGGVGQEYIGGGVGQEYIGGGTGQEYIGGGGAQGNGEFYANGGEKGEKGYNGFDGFQKGLIGKFGKKQDNGFYNNAAGHNAGHQDAAGYYGGHHAAQKGETGGKFGEESSQKKGHKTTGFHNVYHKDEYKKEHSFYDEANKAGHQDQYAKGESAFGAEKGGYKKGGHLDAGYQGAEKGNKGSYNKGNFAQEGAGYKGAKGADSHYQNGAEFGKQGGSNFQKGYGFGQEGYGY